jgi:hypothetical protein
MFFKRGDKKNGSKKKNGKYMQMERKCCGLTEVFFKTINTMSCPLEKNCRQLLKCTVSLI